MPDADCGGCVVWIIVAVVAVFVAMFIFGLTGWVHFGKEIPVIGKRCAIVPHERFAILPRTIDVPAIQLAIPADVSPNRKVWWREGTTVKDGTSTLSMSFLLPDSIADPQSAACVDIASKWGDAILSAEGRVVALEGFLIIPRDITDVKLTFSLVKNYCSLFIDEEIAASNPSNVTSPRNFTPEGAGLAGLAAGAHTFSLRYYNFSGAAKLGDITITGKDDSGATVSFKLTEIAHMPYEDYNAIPKQ